MAESRKFQVFLKPVGATCNLRCGYCYYPGTKQLYPGKSVFTMNDEILELLTIQLIEATTDPEIVFSWHGGEPTMAGMDFFRKALAYQQKYLPSGRTILNGLQTNGTLLNEEWCRFLAENKFYVGLSLDGPEDVHDYHRKDSSGKGSFSAAIRGLRLLQKQGINPEILCVVNARNAGHPLRVYRFFKEQGTRFMTFLPLVNHEPGSPAGVSSDSVNPAAFGEFLVTVFDEWVTRDVENVSVQLFEEAIQTAFRNDHTLCIFKQNCGGVPVVEHNGDFYSCDHFVDPDHLLGNITEKSLEIFLDSPRQKRFGMTKSLALPNICRECSVLEMCNGECPKNRFIRTPEGEVGLNYLCEGYKRFFTHIQPFVDSVKQMAGSERSEKGNLNL